MTFFHGHGRYTQVQYVYEWRSNEFPYHSVGLVTKTASPTIGKYEV